MVIYIQDVLAKRRAAALLATIRMAATGGTRGRAHAVAAHTGRAAFTATPVSSAICSQATTAADLPTLYAEATLI